MPRSRPQIRCAACTTDLDPPRGSFDQWEVRESLCRELLRYFHKIRHLVADWDPELGSLRLEFTPGKFTPATTDESPTRYVPNQHCIVMSRDIGDVRDVVATFLTELAHAVRSRAPKPPCPRYACPERPYLPPWSGSAVVLRALLLRGLDDQPQDLPILRRVVREVKDCERSMYRRLFRHGEADTFLLGLATGGLLCDAALRSRYPKDGNGTTNYPAQHLNYTPSWLRAPLSCVYSFPAAVPSNLPDGNWYMPPPGQCYIPSGTFPPSSGPGTSGCLGPGDCVVREPHTR